MKVEKLLHELQHKTYAMLKPSAVHGIGVFAIQDIPKGCRNIFSQGMGEWIKVPIDQVEILPEHSKSLIETYCLFDDDHYFVPEYGFKVMDLVNYLNHSSEPNLRSIEEGEHFEAIRDIKAGEELLIRYDEIVDNIEQYH